MPDNKKNLYLFEATELRNVYDRHIKLLQRLFEDSERRGTRFFSSDDDEKGNKKPVAEFKQKETEQKTKKLQTKRLKLNQEIQIANFKSKINFQGNQISIAEALEIRKTLLIDIETISERVYNSAYKNIIYKEKRDIINEPKHSFKTSYNEFQNIAKDLRNIINQIHIANHKTVVNFKDE